MKTMHRKVISIIVLFFVTVLIALSQNIVPHDTVIDKGIYKSYYSDVIEGPAFVIYPLYKGGGDCSRKDDFFKCEKGYPHFNYRKSGYDIGHLANAEDFAYDCYKENLTFNYINAIPQTPHLNSGIWKHWEDEVRKESQNDSLLIVCGGCDYNGTRIPQHCFKIVYSLTTGKLLHHLFFNNDNFTNDTIKCPSSIVNKYTYKKLRNLYYGTDNRGNSKKHL